MESTYGDRRHDKTADAMERLAEITNRTAKNTGEDHHPLICH